MPEAFLLILSQTPGAVLAWWDSSQVSKPAESLKWRVGAEVGAFTGFGAEGEAAGGGTGFLRVLASLADDLVNLGMSSKGTGPAVMEGKVDAKMCVKSGRL